MSKHLERYLLVVCAILMLLVVLPAYAQLAPGTLKAWGRNTYNQCNIPYHNNDIKSISAGYSTILSLRADGTMIGGSIPSGQNYDIVKVASGYSFCVARRNNGTIITWGNNDYGQCTIPTDAQGCIDVAAGWYHCVAVKSDGSLVAWGLNDEEQCNVPTGTDYIAVAAGDDHSVALKSDHTVVVWGDNYYGQLNIPAAENHDIVKIACGSHQTIALRSDGTAFAWGRNDYGQCNIPAGTYIAIGGNCRQSLLVRSDGYLVAIGRNAEGQCNVPSPNANFAAASGAFYFSAGVKADGSLIWWGNITGELPRSPGFTGIAGGEGHNLLIKSDGSLLAWGDSTYGQTSAVSGNDFTAVAAGAYHSLALKSDGSIIAWGRDNYGQVSGKPTTGVFTKIASKYNHNLALRSDGALAAWGNNSYNQVTNTPTTGTYTDIAAGVHHNLAVASDGSIAAWGRDDYGQVSNKPTTGTYTAVAAGCFHSVAIKSDGTLVAWGDNNYGQCNVPAGTYDAIAAGYYFTLARRTSDGAVVAWGSNSSGQCIVPSQNSGFEAIAAGGYHSLALLADTTGPTGSIKINDGASYTTSNTVTLSLLAVDEGGTGASEMRFSNDGSAWSAWEPYATTRTGWALSSGDGTKTVFVQFKDHAGNMSTAASDSITFDTTLPTCGEVWFYPYNSSLPIRIWVGNATDSLSGLDRIELYCKAETDANWPEVANSTVVATSPSESSYDIYFTSPAKGIKYTIGVVLVDKAGNKTGKLLGTYAQQTFYDTTVQAAKLTSRMEHTSIENVVVTAIHDEFIYVESEDRTAGVKVCLGNETPSWTPTLGEKVNITDGLVWVYGEEVAVYPFTVEHVGTGTITPIGMNNKAVGGGAFEYTIADDGSAYEYGQQGIAGAYGWNNIGLLIRTYGKVTAIGTDSIYALNYIYINDGSDIQDGSGNVGIKVLGNLPAGVAVGDPVIVTGISSINYDSAELSRLIFTRDASDITKVTTGDTAGFTVFGGTGSATNNWLSLPIAPLNSDPVAVFGDVGRINFNLTRLDPTICSYIPYSSFDPADFGNLLLGEGYLIGNDTGSTYTVSYTGFPDGLKDSSGSTVDMAISMPGVTGQQGGAHCIGMPYNYKVLWTDCLVTDGFKVLFVEDAVTNGWLDGGWTYLDASIQSQMIIDPEGILGSAYLEPGRMYQVNTRKPNLALIIPADRVLPTFGNIASSPRTGRYNDPVAGTVTITFTVSEELKANPTVTVNGNNATNITHTGLDYSCTYTVQSDDPVGPATIVITGMDMAGNEAQATNADALLIGVVTAYTYDSNGNWSMINANGTKTEYSYDERYRLKEVEHLRRNTSGVFSMFKQVNYNLDGVGNRVKIWLDNDDVGQSTIYDYDAINRLTSAGNTSYRYDWVGNLYSSYLSDPNGTNWTYDIVDRLLSNDIYNYDYNNLTGNLTSVSVKGTTPATIVHTYTYDSRGLLKTAN